MITAQSVLPEDLWQLVSVGFIICKSTVNFQRRRFILLASSKKKQLMQLIVDDLVQDKTFHEDNTRHHKLVVTGADPVPIEISEGGVVVSQADLATSHEEADNIIVQQVLNCAAENAESKIIVVADDTDVFVLLLHYHHRSILR